MLQHAYIRNMKRVRMFSTHCKVAVIGGGTAGLASSAQLAKSGTFTKDDITVFDPSDEHHYQPSYTMIGGGVLGHKAGDVKRSERTYVKRPMAPLYKVSGVKFAKESVESMDPENNRFMTNKGEYTYDYLILTPGSKLRYDMIEGAQEALDDPDHPVTSIYREEYAYKTLKYRELMEEGTAVFYQPPNPIKCGGAPLKITFLSESRWRDLGRRNNINVLFYTALPIMFPPCLKFSVALNTLREEKGFPAFFKHQLKSIDKNAKTCVFEHLDTKVQTKVEYDFLHIVPPHTSPDFIAKSPLVNHGSSFLPVDRETLQHLRYPNVFGCGDIVNLPCSKTAAAAFAQVPVVVHNICQAEKKLPLHAKYNGYASCPLFVGDNKLMLAEFLYDGVPAESFSTKQDVPLQAFYYMKKYYKLMFIYNINPFHHFIFMYNFILIN